MITLVWRTDVHVSDEPPIARIDNWTETVLDKLVQVGEVARELEADAVLDGGDLFHRKSPTRNSHQLVQRLINVHQGYHCPTFGNFGNHDAKYGDIRFLDESPLGTLFKCGAIRRLYNEHEAVFTDGDLKVRVVGVPYHGTSYDLSRFESIKKGDEDYLVCIAHVLASPDGGSMFEGEDILPYEFLKGLAPDCVALGHWHKNQGIVDLGNGKTVVNTGSLTRGSLSQDEVDRVPVCVEMSFTKQGMSFKEHPLRVKSPFEVFNLEAKVRQESKEITMDLFVESLAKSLDTDSLVSVEDKIRALQIENEVKETMLQYIENR